MLSQVSNLEVELDPIELDRLLEKGKEILQYIDNARQSAKS